MNDLAAIAAMIHAHGASVDHVVLNPERYRIVRSAYMGALQREADHPRWQSRRFRHAIRRARKQQRGWV